MVFQSYALYPQMSGAGNRVLRPQERGPPQGRDRQAHRPRPEILQIEPFLERTAALSGGQRQRVAIGRALVRDVDVFLFDEPLSNLDAQLRWSSGSRSSGCTSNLQNTMVGVTHDQIEALTLADRIAVMRGGIIQQLADPKTIYNKPTNLFVVAASSGRPR